MEIIIAFVAAIGLAVLFTASYFSNPPAARPWTPEEYDRDATRLRAAGRHAEAKADYEEKRTKMKLKEEELREVEEFLAQQHNKRNGNSKHEGK